MTELDQAHAAMEAAPDDDALRLRFFDRLASSELWLLLDEEVSADRLRPRLFEVDGQSYALVFDRAARATEFAEGPAHTATLSGRVVVAMLAGAEGAGLGLAVNPGVAPSQMLLPAEGVAWLADLLAETPDAHEAQITALHPPQVPQALLEALDRKLAIAAGRADQAWLVTAERQGGARDALLVFLDAAPGAEGALAQIAREALTFSGVEAGTLDVTFARRSDPIAARLAKVGLRFDLPTPAQGSAPKAPGRDPNAPPILR